jgi:cytochrome c553
MIENLIVALIVLTAASWLFVRVYRTVRAATSSSGKKISSCGSCGGCSKTSGKGNDAPVVTLSGPVKNTGPVK